ncbi:hypothetical protein JTE90_028451 [Oedothorax gibbosus]|uniref:PDZ domain-containing protein n=1 Tax=Oedothorax gibbosus TaxID=931172 RepID=A0AAV6VF37_9ARAC|nr:hypothetical protein JTE90_028451 [Oedothorax gibbosus]
MNTVEETEDNCAASSSVISDERTPLGPGTPDVPTAGYIAPSSPPKDHDEAIDVLSNNSSPEMLRHQKHDGQRSAFSTSPYPQESLKNHSPGCDDSGVFLEEPIVSSPETQTRSAISRLHNITQFQKEDTMRQYSIPAEGIDSDDLGLASSSIDSADDLDGDPLPSTLQICPPPAIPNRQKPPPVPARKSPPQKHGSRYSSSEFGKAPLSKSSSSGDDSNFGEGDLYTNEDQLTDLLCHDENTKNLLKNEQSRFAMTRSYHEDTLLGMHRDSQESKTAFLSRTLSTSKKLEVPDGLSKISDNSSAFKWKSEECLRSAAENKWSLTGRRFEKSVSVKDRIAMFSEMEANQTPLKKDLQRYGSENNIKTVTVSLENKKMDLPPTEEHKQQNCLSRDTKWQSLHNISKKSPEKEILYPSSNIKSALSIPSLAPSSSLENPTGNGYSPFPIKLDLEPPKPIVSTYPETQLTNNKRYNYGLYSLKNLKNTEDLLSKKAAGSNLLSIIDTRKQPIRKLKGLVIPEKPQQQDGSKTLPTIVSSDSDGCTGSRDNRRASLPITVVTAAVSKSTSLPRNNDYQRSTSLLAEPPWKSERTKTNSLPKYSPAFKKRNLELPGSSLSPTPPSSLTSPLSPPPSSPSSICSSNASSTLQQNVFQFSLSHSKPVQPLLPEKALMSPTPSLQPSDVEYEGDNSEDSSHSAASPMRNASRAPKENKVTPPSLNSGFKSNTFTSSAKPVVLQPLLVETLVKSTPSSKNEPRAAVCISKTEINLRAQNSATVCHKKDTSSIQQFLRSKKEANVSSNGKDYRSCETVVHTSQMTTTENRNGSYQNPPDFLDGHAPFINGNSNGYQPARSVYTNETSQQRQEIFSNGNHDNIQHQSGNLFSNSNNKKSEDVPVGKFRACPLNLQEKNISRRQLHSDESEDEDDDSHSTLSHRTEDSRHTTTDDCLSDATTDSFEKPRVPNEVPRSTNEDYASTEGYLSDASTTDVSLRRFTQNNRHMDASTEEYLSDATAESPDPEWVSARDAQDFRSIRGYITRNESQAPATGGTVDLRPKRLSQQKTVLKAPVEPSGSVQKFKALAEKWEQRSDVVTSPPPPQVSAPLLPKKEQPRSAPVPLITSLLSSTSSATVTKGKSSTLPPSLMPRSSNEKKQSPPMMKSPSAETQDLETNGWSSHCETQVSLRRDSSSSSSSSSKATLKDVEDTTPAGLQKALNSDTRTNSLRSDTWNNEPRNRRGADFSRSEYQPPARPSYSASSANKSNNFSDIRRNFENVNNNNKEEDKSAVVRKKTPPVLPDRSPPTPTQPPVALPRRVPSSCVSAPKIDDEETRQLLEQARSQLQNEGSCSGVQLLSVQLRREGSDGGSVGITLAGGADYEVKEITVHKVISGSIADRDGRVMKGDRVMSINGRDVRGVSHGEALHILKAPSPRVVLVLARIVAATGQNCADKAEGKRQSVTANQQGAETFLVELQKDATGVGFSIEGGKDSPQGDRPLLIKRLFKGGAADKEGRLEEGDEISSINNQSVTNMTRTEAWNFLKKLPEGVVQLQVKKPKASAS